ncbi:MAG TPA: phospho-sugar mutase [Candidatus Gallacutalibacter stercoravium]|nr:phospho-sugar mutase [Candidatus Gallacutalibacter stercoravium]
MDINEQYACWRQKAVDDVDLQRELEQIAGKPEEITDRFYRDLAFGTGGLRGVIGAGTNRMNIYTVRKATQGLANYLLQIEQAPSVAIAYDSRIKSDRFAKEAAMVLAANGIHVHLYPELMPTPALSFAVRHLQCTAGICVTASHNPAKYNGYKVYGSDGCQITLEAADRILKQINQVDPFDGVRTMPFDQALGQKLARYIGEETVTAFINAVKAQSTRPGADPSTLKVVYTPLNGTGRRCVTRVLRELGICNVTVVPEQEMPDGNFPTCPFPNPEIKEALQVGLKLCEQVQPDLLLATDPDCDRVGIAVADGGEYKLLTGNEVGVLLLDYIARCRIAGHTMPQDPVAVKTIVTTDMATAVAKHYGIELRNVLTGFKFIGEQIGLLEQQGQADRFVFGFEESYGYLSGSHVRDKDAVNASMLICEMALSYKAHGKTLVQAMDELYQTYGYYNNQLMDFTFEGADGMRRMQDIMQVLRNNTPRSLAQYLVTGYLDYQTSRGYKHKTEVHIDLPKSDVLEYRLENGSRLIIRPSGTEPKIKIYLSSKGKTRQEALERNQALRQAAQKLMENDGHDDEE